MDIRSHAIKSKGIGSTSSPNASDEELYMEANDVVDDRHTILGKRKKVLTRTEQIISDSETEEPRSGKEKRMQKDGAAKILLEDIKKYKSDREEVGLSTQETEESELEMVKAKHVKEQKKVDEEDEFETIVNSVHNKIRDIVKSVNRESGGKIQVTRNDQQTVKDSAAGLLSELVSIIMKQRSLEKQLSQSENEKNKAILERNNARAELRTIKSRGIVSGDSGEESESFTNKSSRRSYAQVSSMNGSVRKQIKRMSERENEKWETVGTGGKKEGVIKGRVVATGKEGWKTPPLARKRASEQAVLVSGKQGQTPKALVAEITKQVPVKDIGGPPKAVRTIRDGKVVIISKDKDQNQRLPWQGGGRGGDVTPQTLASYTNLWG